MITTLGLGVEVLSEKLEPQFVVETSQLKEAVWFAHGFESPKHVFVDLRYLTLQVHGSSLYVGATDMVRISVGVVPAENIEPLLPITAVWVLPAAISCALDYCDDTVGVRLEEEAMFLINQDNMVKIPVKHFGVRVNLKNFSEMVTIALQETAVYNRKELKKIVNSVKRKHDHVWLQLPKATIVFQKYVLEDMLRKFDEKDSIEIRYKDNLSPVMFVLNEHCKHIAMPCRQ